MCKKIYTYFYPNVNLYFFTAIVGQICGQVQYKGVWRRKDDTMARKETKIYKRKDGRWEARYLKEIGLDGKKRYGSVYGASYTEAKQKRLAIIQNTRIRGTALFSLLLSDIMLEWLQSTRNNIKPNTHQKYEGIIKNHIKPCSIGNTNIRFLTSKSISAFADEKVAAGLSLKTVNDILIVIGLALNYAEEVYHIPKIKIYFLKTRTKEMRVLDNSEQKVLESFLVRDMDLYKFSVLLALYTGIRIGELCALDWSDVTDEIKISKTLYRIKRGNKTVLEIGDPKTVSSNRIIPIPDCIRDYVEQFRSYGSLLKTRNGTRVEPRLLQLNFEKYISACGLPKTNFHALRHTFATRCVEAGFDIKSLSEILGHTDVKTTLNKYVHSSMKQKQKNMALLNMLY